MDEDLIEPIPKTMEKFFGCSGQMVKPALATVRNVVRGVRKGKLVTMEQVQQKLASDFGVEAACPARITKALQLIAQEPRPAGYWRVVKKNGALIPKFPDGVRGHAALLKREGFQIDTKKKSPSVVDYQSNLATLH